MFFMGAESAEDRQFAFGGTGTLDLDGYLTDPDRGRVRAWWRDLGEPWRTVLGVGVLVLAILAEVLRTS